MGIRYKKYRIYAVLCVALLLYMLLRTRQQHFTSEFVVENSSPILVWEFVADFSNMKMLNPTIMDFNIVSEHGNYDHWEYSTEYTEFLSNFPYVTNFAHGDFIVKPDGNDFIIVSNHRTCFFSSLACVHSQSEFRFSASKQSPGTFCAENITYECPAVFSGVCEREVSFQREAIRDNLRRHFQSQNSHMV